MNLIIEKSESIDWYTDLYPFFEQIPEIIGSYHWLWTDIEMSTGLPEHEVDQYERVWISGDTLLELARRRPQFNWPVLSAISPDDLAIAKRDETDPFADCNGDLWRGKPRPQHPYAKFEIVCWDSSATLLINADETLQKAFCRAYPDCIDLDALNRSVIIDN